MAQQNPSFIFPCLRCCEIYLTLPVADVRLLLRSELLQRERPDERQQRHLRRQDHQDASAREEPLQGEGEGANHHDKGPERRGRDLFADVCGAAVSGGRRKLLLLTQVTEGDLSLSALGLCLLSC